MTPRVKQYAAEEAMRAGVLASDVLGTSKRPKPVRARMAVIRRLIDDGFTQSQIGRWLERHPSTISHAVRDDEQKTLSAMRMVLPGLASDADRKSAIMHMRQVRKISDATCASLIAEFRLESA